MQSHISHVWMNSYCIDCIYLYHLVSATLLTGNEYFQAISECIANWLTPSTSRTRNMCILCVKAVNCEIVWYYAFIALRQTHLCFRVWKDEIENIFIKYHITLLSLFIVLYLLLFFGIEKI